MEYTTRYRSFLLVSTMMVFACFSLIFSPAAAQITGKKDSTTVRKRVPRENVGIVKTVTIMPYITASYNFQSGQAFPKGAQGLGYGFGIAFDLTEEKQPIGAYFDFAYQDMRGSVEDGACKLINQSDTVTSTVPVKHYFSYALFEAFVKFQSAKSNGYFLLGASAGIATTALTVKEGPGTPFYTDWHGSEFYNSFRLDIRAGLGIKLGYISGHQVVFEARFGYPVTTVISDYHDICNGSTAHGSWRVVTMQGNIGLRL